MLPLIGVTMTETQFAMISEWMVNKNISDFVKANQDVDRLGLVDFSIQTLRFKLFDKYFP